RQKIRPALLQRRSPNRRQRLSEKRRPLPHHRAQARPRKTPRRHRRPRPRRQPPQNVQIPQQRHLPLRRRRHRPKKSHGHVHRPHKKSPLGLPRNLQPRSILGQRPTRSLPSRQSRRRRHQEKIGGGPQHP